MNTDILIRSSRRLVLVVEDEAINREILGMILSEQYEVLNAENGEIALSRLREYGERISMVLLDINMPVMDGLTLLKIMKSDEALRAIPVIVLTADRNSELETLRLGALDFIPKPYDMPEIILARVDRIIQFSEDRRIISDVEHDELTGLYTRSFFHEYCERIMTSEPERRMDMLAFDIDRFRMVNELYGKPFGDEVLLALSDGIREILRDSFGIACRCEADLFFVFLEHTEQYEEICRRVNRHINALEKQNNIRLRMGVYPLVDSSRELNWFSDAAKSACSSVRGRYNSSFRIYDSRMHERELYQERLIAGIETAFREKQFCVYYQPKYDISGESPRLCSAEALVRWIHPELGQISPAVFIPILEERGLITRLDDYIWRDVAADICRWEKCFEASVPVSVNLSRMDLFDPTLRERLLAIVSDSGIRQDKLMLEVTESAYTENLEQVLAIASDLRRLGFRLEMDDFGSGYSSLNMLCVMPVDAIKIDMEFVRNLAALGEPGAAPPADGGKAFRMLELVIALAHNLRVPAVIEGVETDAQYALVKRAGCDVVQGYYFSRPVDTSTFETILQRQQK